jgi:lipopolysaccharide/colanic/teichoic acid biosynthesis glycosyltransferase
MPYRLVKSQVERMICTAMLIISLPLLLAVASLVKLTSAGPVLYSQARLGRGGRIFRVYKIRTMVHQCEAHTGPVWAVRDDPRVTPVGRFLRDTHIDEIPQLWNVIRGEMSLIGPRPERPEIASKIAHSLPAYDGRLDVRPGLTGLAQVRLPPDSDLSTVRQKLTYDLYYIRNLGLWLDVRIAAATGLYLFGRVAKSLAEVLIRSHAARAERGRIAEPQTPNLTITPLATHERAEPMVKAA